MCKERGPVQWIEKKTGVEIKKHIKNELPALVELTERRNLFVHSDGKIDSKYLSNCKKNKIVLDKSCKKGTELYVPSQYFKDSYVCLYTISTKITYLLWKKLSKEDKESEKLNTFLNNEICINLIREKNYKLSSSILKFIFDNFKNSTSDVFQKILIINQALSKKLNGEDKEAIEIINSIDWSATNNDLKLAVSIIKGDNEEALILMEKIGESGDFINQENYKSDPIFIPIRELDKFRALYKKIFKEDYLSLEQEINPNKDLMKNNIAH
jgi:hypothetical protein